MDKVLNFLANNYLWFLGASVFFAFALFGLIYEGKKKKKAEEKAAKEAEEAAAAQAQAPEAPQLDTTTPAPVEGSPAEAPAPTLEGLEANNAGYQADTFNVPEAQTETLVIDENAAPASEEPTLVIEDPAATPASEEPTLVIEDPATKEQPQNNGETSIFE